MREEIKVRLVRGEDDNYNELWREIVPNNKGRYFCRHTFGNFGTWYTVCDPLGYCELNDVVSEDVIFIICDDKGNELFKNNNSGKPFPKFETVVKQKWDEFKENIQHNVEDLTKNFFAECWNGDTTMKINQWLISYKDPDLYPNEIEEMYGYDENWTGCWHEREISYEPIPNTEFEYLGNKYQFVKVKHRHDVCGVEWYEFVCADSPYTISEISSKYRPWINTYMCMGNWFDDTTHGTMYDQRTAREIVIKSLLKIFPKEKEYGKLLYVQLGNRKSTWCTDYCYEKNYADTADILINRDYHRSSVESLCQKIEKGEFKDKVFINNRENKEHIKEMYPDIYGYDWCLI